MSSSFRSKSRPRHRALRIENLEERLALSVTWVVNYANDVSTWSDTDSQLSLREAVDRAEDGDRIVFDESIAGSKISMFYGQLEVGCNLEIDASAIRAADGTNGITLSCNVRDRAFYVQEGVTLALDSINIGDATAKSDGDGGAIYNRGILYMNNCRVSTCKASYGGGVFNWKGLVVIDNCVFTANYASEYGGAVYSDMGVVEISRSSIEYNSANVGGGLDMYESSLTVESSSIYGNTAYGDQLFGGGLFCLYGDATIVDSEILANAAQSYGGGLYNYCCDMQITNTLIAANESLYTGAGIQNFGTITMVQCTVAGNETLDDYSVGAGIFNDPYSLMYVYNSIVCANHTPLGDSEMDVAGNGEITGQYVLVASTSTWLNVSDYWIYRGERLFRDMESWDFRLELDSQAVDRGYDGFAVYPWGEGITLDLEGKPRIQGESVDLGAYELTPPEPLPVPENVSAASGGANRVTLSWDSVEGSEGYCILWTSDTGMTPKSVVCEGTSHTLTGLDYGAQVTARVLALGDGEVYYDSDYSQSVSLRVCPMDIDGGGSVGPSDYTLLSAAWLSSEGDSNWAPRCDINGDGWVGTSDYLFLVSNWGKRASASDLEYPSPVAAPLPVLAVPGDSGETLCALAQDALESALCVSVELSDGSAFDAESGIAALAAPCLSVAVGFTDALFRVPVSKGKTACPESCGTASVMVPSMVNRAEADPVCAWWASGWFAQVDGGADGHGDGGLACVFESPALYYPLLLDAVMSGDSLDMPF